jgi:histidine triad (HIT) family protein
MRDCVFCRIVAGELPSWKVYEDNNVLAFFEANPVSEYHTLVIPKKHYKDIFDTPETELENCMSAIKTITTLLREKAGIENMQIVNSSGAEAQQEVFHIHFHIVPRSKNDGQDMVWMPHLEIKDRYDELLSKIH